MKKILVTGSNGQLGRCLQDAVENANNPEFQFLFLDKNHLDISRSELVETFFFSNQVDYCINCAAYTQVDKAEIEVEEAFRVNSDAVQYLARECAEQGAVLIHISTDYVFDGKIEEPYFPYDKPNPINVYGKSKLEGERFAMELNPKTIIIRTSWLYSQYGKNFYTTMVKLMREKQELKVVDDQTGKPTHAKDLANFILNIIQSGDTRYGIRHFTGSDKMTWYEFALKIAKENGFKTKISPIPTSEYPTPAERPKWSVLEDDES
ncbi:MAG: dTDP-4-dehydrorhamnose reductase [Weeksellaceae bacterium]